MLITNSIGVTEVIFYCVAFGALMGFIGLFISVAVRYFATLNNIPKSVIKASGNIRILPTLIGGYSHECGRAGKFIADFLSTLEYAALIMLLLYVTSDGQVRIYIICLSSLTAYAVQRALKVPVETLAKFVFVPLRIILLYGLSVAVQPIIFLHKLFNRLSNFMKMKLYKKNKNAGIRKKSFCQSGKKGKNKS